MLDQSFMEAYHWTNDQFGNALLLNINKISSQTASFCSHLRQLVDYL